MAHRLDRDIREWRIFEDVLPVFLEEEDSWIPEPSATPAELTTFKSHIVNFLSDIVTTKDYRPNQLLSGPDYRQCIARLTNLLAFLEKEIILGTILESKATKNEMPLLIPQLSQPSAILDNNKPKFLEWLKQEIILFTTKVQDRDSADSGVDLVDNNDDDNDDDDNDDDDDDNDDNDNDDDDDDDGEGDYPKLAKLGQLLQKGLDKEDTLLFCKKHVRWQLSLRLASMMEKLAEDIKGAFRSANPVLPIYLNDTEICKWNEAKPWTDSAKLYNLLSKSTCREGHEVSLQLDGFNMSSDDPMILLAFLTSCPLVPPGHWREGGYRPVPREPKHANLIGDLCKHLNKRPSQRLDVLFTNECMWYQRHKPVARPSQVREAYPTVSLAQLLRYDILDDEASGSRFKIEDKAVLAFSLSLCLLHLFQGLWMPDVWDADAIYFLYKETNRGGQIFDIHYPYIKRSLSRDQIITNRELRPDECRACLLAFAKLLVEIDEGKTFTLQANEKFDHKMWGAIQSMKAKGRIPYAEAVTGAFEFMKRKRVASLKKVRRLIFQDVIWPLQQNYLPYSNVMEDPRDGPFDIPAINHSNPRTNVAATLTIAPTSTTTPQSSLDSAFFDGFLKEENDENVVGASESFYAQFNRFRRHFITPRMMNRRNGRSRLKIAVLDTGIDDDDTWLCGALKEARGAREIQGVADADETSPIVSYWPSKEAAVDNCGHGTHVAYLLLRFAPDVDICIAKVSDGMTFDNTDKVADAIDWAVQQGADIISMSFGTRRNVTKIETAIGSATTKPEHPTIILAAASNYGLNEHSTFPARDSRVICVYAFDGMGGVGNINPVRPATEANFGTLGRGIKLHWRGKTTARSGTSYATPILAAIVANLLDWLGYHATAADTQSHDGTGQQGGENEMDTQCDITLKEYNYLRKVESIRHILEKHMSEKEGKLYYVAPWILFPSNKLSEVGPEGAENSIIPAERAKAIRAEKKILGTLTLKLPEIT